LLWLLFPVVVAFAVACFPIPPDTPVMIEQAFVYIMSSSFQKLYIGVTTEIEIRISQHKGHKDPDSHTSRYRIDKLVYYECFGLISQAIAREKQLKKWSRIKKIRLIVAQNPTWQDLSAEWGKPAPPFDWSKPLRPI
jgi:putative endonuclease